MVMVLSITSMPSGIERAPSCLSDPWLKSATFSSTGSSMRVASIPIRICRRIRIAGNSCDGRAGECLGKRVHEAPPGRHPRRLIIQRRKRL